MATSCGRSTASASTRTTASWSSSSGPRAAGRRRCSRAWPGSSRPTSGSIKLDGRETSRLTGRDLTAHRRDTVGVVFQAFNLIPSLSAHGNVVAPMRLAGMSRRHASARATELLERVGLGERGHHRPGQLSGGQQQRVAIARALVHDPPAGAGRRAHGPPRPHPGRGRAAAPAGAGVARARGDRLDARRPGHPPGRSRRGAPAEPRQRRSSARGAALRAGRAHLRAGQPGRPRLRGGGGRGGDLPNARRRHGGAARHRDRRAATSGSWAPR